MTAITKEEYKFFKSQNPEALTQEELNWINEYEKAEAGAPSAEDLEWARFIVNEKDPQYQKINRESGDLDKALKIMRQDNAARQVMQQKGQDHSVKKVTSTPEKVVKDGGFNFNWRGAYENVKNEKLRATEADAKKLQEFINSNMYNIDDDVKLQQIAYNLHMYNPNTMDWSDFINSEQGEEFKKYLEDVRKAQTEKAVEDIWEGKDPVKVNYPFIGYTDVPLSRQAVNFMLPVSKEYAKNHYNDEDFSIAGPLATDLVTNLVMTGPSGVTKTLPIKAATNAEKALNVPLISFLYGNVAAPTITETGNAIFNKESIPEAIARTVEGTAINIGTPRILEGLLSSAGRGIPKGDNRSVQKMIDEATNKAEKIRSDIKKGKPYPVGTHLDDDLVYEYKMLTPEGKKYFSTGSEYSNSKWSTRNYESVANMTAEAVTDAEYKAYIEGIPFSRSKAGNSEGAKKVKEIQDAGSEYLKDALVLQKAQALAKDGNLSSLKPSELRQLGFSDKESFMNWLIRSIKNNVPETVQTYLTNASGRPEFGREAGPIENINRLLGTNLFGKDKTQEEKQKSRIQRLLGL